MEKSKQKLALRIIKISVNTLFYIVIAVLLVFSVANIQVKKENDIANVFGRGFLSVQSESMSGDLDDSFEMGDMVFVKMLNDSDRENLVVGDIVTYFDLTIRAFNTHRIIEIYENDGEMFLITQGDNTPGPDQPIRASDAKSLSPTDLVAMFISFVATHVCPLPNADKRQGR